MSTSTPPAYPEDKKVAADANLESGLESDNDSSINTLHALIAEGKNLSFCSEMIDC